MKSIKTFFKRAVEAFMNMDPIWFVIAGAFTNQEILMLTGITLLITEKRN
tara:strand:+ start:1410 stop:1559 length:150 start_codon:yes stop_codon:yes gene_type:complete